MTLSTSDNVARYAAAVDQTVFTYGFRVDDADHLEVYVDSLLQSGGYAVSGVGNDSGGNVTFTTAPRQSGDPAKTVTLLRKVPLTQTTDLPTQGALPTEAIEDELDRLVMRTQQLDEVDQRSFKVPVESTVSGLELTPEAGKLIGWNGGATALANYANSAITAGIVPTVFMETMLADGTAAEALATLGISMAPVDVSIDNSGYPAAGEITLTAGVLHYVVDSATSGSGANDCGKINVAAGMADGTVITLRKKDVADPTFLSHGAGDGNLHCLGDRSVYLDTHHAVRFMRIGTEWYELRGKGLVRVQGFGTPGANMWTRPEGVTHALVMVIGGGGGGGIASGANYRTSGSGSCRGQAVGFYYVSDQTSVTVTIGAGGACAAAGLNGGSAGGSSTFGSYCTGGGGNGGGGAGSSTANYAGGGNATGGNIKNISGAPGLTGYVCLTGSGPGCEVHACKPIPGWPFGPGGVQTTNPTGSATNFVSNNWPGQGGLGRAATPADGAAYDGQAGADGYCVVWAYSL